MADYRVQFEVFEGPLDLLLYLVKKEEVDIYQVNLTKIASEFIDYIEVMRKLDLEIAGEFLVMAATLVYIKSRELLPKEKQIVVEGEEDEEDPRWELIRQLVEYKKFKEAAETLQSHELDQENVFPRDPGKIKFEQPRELPKEEISVFDLINAVNKVLNRFNDRPQDTEIFEERWTVSEKIELLRSRILHAKKLDFTDLFSDAQNKSEVVVTFLAMLEMIRLKQVVVHQAENFGSIEISRALPTPSDPQLTSETSSKGTVNSEASFSQ